MHNTTITIITVTYNAAELLEKTILSVLQQTHNNVEYIIMDGNSTDATVECIRKYKDQLSYWESKPDRGIYHAMNKGVAKASLRSGKVLLISITIKLSLYYPNIILFT